MAGDAATFRNLEDLSDSETEVHPNIDPRSFYRFLREERRQRLEELRSRSELTREEVEEKARLEYKFLPIAREVVEEGSYSMPVRDGATDEDYSEDLLHMLENGSIDSILRILDEKDFDLEHLEEYILLNESEAIKDGDDELGLMLCRLALLVKWARTYGREYIVRMRELGDEQMQDAYRSHYAASKSAILGLQGADPADPQSTDPQSTDTAEH